ncbi:MAG: hypothetical protein ACYCQI_11895 [Gammaproteobacteria bacterium]
MKLYRFIAADTQSAMFSAHEALGAEALIYSTRKTAEGIEVLAGLASKEEPGKKSKAQLIEVDNLPPPPKVKPSAIESRMFDSLKIQLQNTNEKLHQLNQTIESLQQVVMNHLQRKPRVFNMMKKVSSFLKLSPKQLREGFYGRNRTV